MSKAPPARIASFVTVATTSPVESLLRMAGPARAAWWATTCASRKEAWSQLETAQRCRMTPATACVAPSPSRTSVQTARAWLSCSTMPFWIARPIANGISACATIQATPKSMPATSVRDLVPSDPQRAAARASACRGFLDWRQEAGSRRAPTDEWGRVLLHAKTGDEAPPSDRSHGLERPGGRRTAE